MPPGAEVIDVSGKTVLPGLHRRPRPPGGFSRRALSPSRHHHLRHHRDLPGRPVDLGAEATAPTSARSRGPRIWTSGQAIGGVRTETERRTRARCAATSRSTTPEEARKAVRDKKEHGYDLIKLNEFISYDLVHAAADEAHKLGIGGHRAQLGRDRSAKAGVDGIEHIWSVGYSSILDVKRRRKLAKQRLAGKIEQELAGAYYEPENYDEVIERDGGARRRLDADHRQVAAAAVAERAALPRARTPNPRRSRRRSSGGGARDHRRTPTTNCSSAIRRQQLERTKIGYEKANEFIRRFVAGRRHSQGRLRSAARHGGDADARGAGDGRRGGRAADDGDPGGHAQRRQDLQEGQGLRQRRARQGRRPFASSKAIR